MIRIYIICKDLFVMSNSDYMECDRDDTNNPRQDGSSKRTSQRSKRLNKRSPVWDFLVATDKESTLERRLLGLLGGVSQKSDKVI